MPKRRDPHDPFPDPRCWKRQARDDLLAGSDLGASQTKPCHRRYWYQQSYEKFLKAYALAIKWRQLRDDKEFCSIFVEQFLKQHSPLSELVSTLADAAERQELEDKLRKKFPSTWRHSLNELRQLCAALQTFVNDLKGCAALRRIDKTALEELEGAVSIVVQVWARDNN